MISRRYQKSECKKKGWLHDYKQLLQTNEGFLERCTRCGDKQHFKVNGPNTHYLAYHIRNILRADDPRFAREYPHVKH